jgi:redox-sensitive bicupin YhaK (pirin superfamily)
MHGVQLWVNLPAAEKWTPPRYQDIAPDRVTLLASADGAALVRVIAGEVDGHPGPGQTRTPIAYAHATLYPGARLEIPWRQDFNGLVYALAGSGRVGIEGRRLVEGQLAVLVEGDHIAVTAADHAEGPSKTFEVLILGGRPIREPVVQYGPFVMTTRDEIYQAIEDYQAGRMGRIPPITLPTAES